MCLLTKTYDQEFDKHWKTAKKFLGNMPKKPPDALYAFMKQAMQTIRKDQPEKTGHEIHAMMRTQWLESYVILLSQ